MKVSWEFHEVHKLKSFMNFMRAFMRRSKKALWRWYMTVHRPMLVCTAIWNRNYFFYFFTEKHGRGRYRRHITTKKQFIVSNVELKTVERYTYIIRITGRFYRWIIRACARVCVGHAGTCSMYMYSHTIVVRSRINKRYKVPVWRIND
jgi:hypothetical protein